ncbi:MAG: zinc-ribbon domain-containing protein, partial [Deltaproteobacteria bacterium]|nr:zinc-ribbon domain-containing protein [Deltaproteobacteria bacterium]
MFVTCENCDAEYELDDAKIPAGGARLRCTSCDHSFIVTPPEASDIRSADDLAHDALTAERRPEADPDPEPKSASIKSFDFSGEAEADPEFEAALEAASEEGFDPNDETEPDPAFEAAMDEGFDIDTEAAAGAENEVASEEGLDLDVEVDSDSEIEAASEEGLDLDVEVDLDSEIEVASEEELDLDVEVDSDSEFAAAPEEGFDLNGEADPETELEAASEEGFDLNREADPDSEIQAASEEDFDPDGEDEWEFNEDVESSEPEAGGDAPEPPLETTESPFDEGDDWSDLSKAEEVVDELLGSSDVIEADAAAAVDDLLGEVDSVESLSGESDEDLPAESERPSAVLDIGGAPAIDDSNDGLAADSGGAFEDLSDWEMFDQPAESDGSAVSAGAGLAAAARDGTRAEPQVEIAVEMDGDTRTAKRWTDRVVAVVGWGAVCALMSVALVGSFTSNLSDAKATLGSWSGAGFEADRIAGRWVDNATVGSIYVVSGRVRRASGSGRAAQKTLGIRLIDTKGREIDRTPIPLAPTVPERILRESSLGEIDIFQAGRAGRVAAVGERWISFEAVVTDLPRFAGR